MTEFDMFVQKVQEKFPDLTCKVDKAETKSGSSWIDIFSDEDHLTIEFSPSYGFGLYKGDSAGYGDGPEEIYRSQEFVLKRINSILKDHKYEVYFGDLQEMFGQVSVASKEDDLSDDYLQELITFIKGHGGVLEINAHFKECDLPISIHSISGNR